MRCRRGAVSDLPAKHLVAALLFIDERRFCESGGGAPLPSAPSRRREAWFRWLTEYCLYFGLARGGVYALASRQVVATAVTGPPNTVSFSHGIDAHNIRKAGGGSMAMGAEVLLNPRMQSLGLWQHQTWRGSARSRASAC